MSLLPNFQSDWKYWSRDLKVCYLFVNNDCVLLFEWLSTTAAEGVKSIEIDKCKQDLHKLQGEMISKQWAPSNAVWLYCLADLPLYTLAYTHTHRASLRTLELEQRQQSLVRARDVPHYPKYVLSQETVEYLKNPTFDIWHWDANEMLCLLEHMYHELGIVTELMISPIVLRRWLVSAPVSLAPMINIKSLLSLSLPPSLAGYSR